MSIEWPTVALAATIYTLWFAIVLGHRSMPAPVTVVALGLVVAWHGSLQHELLHGHPFGSPRANDALGAPPLSLRLPYRLYRRDHLLHHNDDILTDPVKDRESFYVDADAWAERSRLGRAIAVFHHSLLGRMLIGPIVANISTTRSQYREVRAGGRAVLRWWSTHAMGVAIVMIFVVGVAGMPAWVYLLGAGYLAHSVSLIRSYCEHRWVPGAASRSAVVRAGTFFSLLFLNNNLHHAHHARPRAAWFRLPALAQHLDSDAAAAEGAGLYHGYREVFGRFLLRPFDHPVHPADRERAGLAAA